MNIYDLGYMFSFLGMCLGILINTIVSIIFVIIGFIILGFETKLESNIIPHPKGMGIRDATFI